MIRSMFDICGAYAAIGSFGLYMAMWIYWIAGAVLLVCANWLAVASFVWGYVWSTYLRICRVKGDGKS